MIGQEIQVTVVDIRGDKVRLGIQAPKDVAVHRKEVFEAIRRENRSAAGMKPQDVDNIPQPQSTPAKPRMRIVPAEQGDAPIGGKEAVVQAQAAAQAAADPSVRQFIKAAVEEARKGLSEGGLPIGSVLVRGGKIIGAGHNRRVQNGDPMAHAEIDCLSKAGRQKSYKDTVLYSTLMPCYLCSGAVVQFGIPRVIVGESANFPGGPEFMRGHGVEVIDLHDGECIDMMARFIREHPELWNEDIGHEHSHG